MVFTLAPHPPPYREKKKKKHLIYQCKKLETVGAKTQLVFVKEFIVFS